MIEQSKYVQSDHRAARRSGQDGFSLLELVVAVSIMLILGVVGFIAYQHFTDNARQAAVESAANQVLTATVAAYNEPHHPSPGEPVRQYNATSDEIVTNIATANATELTIRAEDTAGTIAMATVAGNFADLDETAHSEAGVTYGWEGTPHNSPSVKYVHGEAVAKNYINNPRFKNNAQGWQASVQGRDDGETEMTFDIVSSEGLFTSEDFGTAVGSEVARIQRVVPVPRDMAVSVLIKLNDRIPVGNHTHIGYAVPIQGNGKTWLYFRDGDNRQSKFLPKQPQNDNVDGEWIITSGEIPEGVVYADPYFGTFLNDVYFGSPILVMGHSQEDVDTQLEHYFDGDSQ